MSSGQFPIAVGFQPVPLFLHHSRLATQQEITRHDRNASGSCNLSVSRLNTTPEIAIPILRDQQRIVDVPLTRLENRSVPSALLIQGDYACPFRALLRFEIR